MEQKHGLFDDLAGTWATKLLWAYAHKSVPSNHSLVNTKRERLVKRFFGILLNGIEAKCTVRPKRTTLSGC
jgi:hypothetical protein